MSYLAALCFLCLGILTWIRYSLRKTSHFRINRNKSRRLYLHRKKTKDATHWVPPDLFIKENFLPYEDQGELRIYRYRNGVKSAQGPIKNGEKEGSWSYWFHNGQKQAEGSFRAGQPEGLWTYYSREKIIKQEHKS